MELSELSALYTNSVQQKKMLEWIASDSNRLHLKGLKGSSAALFASSVFKQQVGNFLFVLNDEESAGYFYNDLTQILGKDTVYFFPSSYKHSIKYNRQDVSNGILRTEALNALTVASAFHVIVTCPDAVAEKIVSKRQLQDKTLVLKSGDALAVDDLVDVLLQFHFNRVDFVYEPGQFSVRGGIVDIFSFSSEYPYRIDFLGNEIDTIRTFDIESQLSKERQTQISVIPNVKAEKKDLISFFNFLPENTLLFFKDTQEVKNQLSVIFEEQQLKVLDKGDGEMEKVSENLISAEDFVAEINRFRIVEFGTRSFFETQDNVIFSTSAQPVFMKNFNLVSQNLLQHLVQGYKVYILSDSKKQTDRIRAIFQDRGDKITFQPVLRTLHEGFLDNDLKVCCYTDHQIFDRFHKFSLRTESVKMGKVVSALKELNQFQLGDYVVHIDHGIGRFGGLIEQEKDGTKQEVIKLIYKDGDIVLVSIHALHRISKYKGKDGEPPRITKLGGNAWQNLKDRTKKKVKDIARDLITLYAKRMKEKGFAFPPDSYLQHELEASFFYEDTPDQEKATADVKRDMERARPMDRLICGDVGFGKTEIAVRAAFKAATEGKQVAVLVPTTVLALQHFKTFSERLKDFPCKIDYLSRAKKASQQKEILQQLKEGKIDIIIGTHRLIGKDVAFHDLGLLIIDEEQKFGVSVKEKLKQIKVNVDTLTLTATPIPRTLQFSLMGARDLSVMHTPPPNRYPVQTEVIEFNEDIIREAIRTEIDRNGQVFLVNNRISNIEHLESIVKKLVPEARTVVAHGQMESQRLEEIILDFVNYEYDVLIATSIIESGIDIPNANTIIINNAQNFGLSDLHQLRGRVGRSNRKAYCYLLTPSQKLLTADAKKRLQAIENFSDLGSGFNLSMQDLDIRGAGNMLGAEQSGFIVDLGYETYQKILNEAVTELKDEEFSELYAEQQEGDGMLFVSDCAVESDLELMFPHDYIENVSERMSLYRELDNIENEKLLREYENRLIDRFGPLPPQARDLILMVRARFLAMELGFEKLVLKEGKMFAYFVSNPDSAYYKSDTFGKVLHYIQYFNADCKLRDRQGKRSLLIEKVTSIEKVYDILQMMKEG